MQIWIPHYIKENNYSYHSSNNIVLYNVGCSEPGQGGYCPVSCSEGSGTGAPNRETTGGQQYGRTK